MKPITTIFFFLVFVLSIGCGGEAGKSTPETNPSIQDDVAQDDSTLNVAFREAIKYENLQQELLQKMNDLTKNSTQFDKYLASSIKLYKNKKYADYSDLQDRVQKIPERFEHYGYKMVVEKLTPVLNNDTIPDAFKYNITKGICRKYTTSVKLDSALIYFKLINELYPRRKDKCIDISFPCITSTDNFLDSLRKENILPEKFLFLEAKSRMKLIECSCWFGGSWYNLSTVTEKYQELLSKYPDSEYADDAEFWLIGNRFYGEEQGGYPVSEIPKIKQFINKYPNSNRIPELIINIAYSYSIGSSTNPEEKIKQLDKGIEELKDLKINYQLDSLQVVEVKQLLDQLMSEKGEQIFDFTIVPLQRNYKIGEDIEVEIILKNKSSTTQKLKLFQNDSYSSFVIYPNRNIKFTPRAKTDNIKTEFTILRNESLKQKIKINELARHWDGGRLGQFSFEKEGVYYLNCFSRANYLTLKNIKINIIK